MPFEFSIPNSDKLATDHAHDKKDFSGTSFGPAFFLKKGVTQVRILPPYPGLDSWYRQITEHIFEGGRTFTCATEAKRACPMCDLGKQLYQSGEREKIEISSKLKPRVQFLMNALVFSAPQGVDFGIGQVYILKVPKTVKRDLLAMDQDKQSGWWDITGAFHSSQGKGIYGVSINITRSGAGLNTEYTCLPCAQRSDLKELLASHSVNIDELTLHNLSEAYPVLGEDELRKATDEVLTHLTKDKVGFNTTALKFKDFPNAAPPKLPFTSAAD